MKHIFPSPLLKMPLATDATAGLLKHSRQALARSAESSSSAKAAGCSSGDHKEGFPDLFDLFDGLAQGKEAG